MTPERWQQVKALVESALERRESQREAFLNEACAGDPLLREQVEKLIASYEEAQSRWEAPAVEFVAESIATRQGKSMIGQQIGLYKIVDEIGRGGMGIIYLAVRADNQFRKRVAIKLVKRGMDTDLIIRRFRNERQILAGLDHPNIAKLLDGGTTEEGLPYFVMDYIEGLPIDQYCDHHQLSTMERLKLFRTVCSAVQYAHQNLVVHRDLKPNNILVTAEGTPKLLDFGIAKLLNPELSAQTLEPTLAFRLMTPDYASLEQVRGETITTASDIYSLGVVLYELLTGHRPYHFKSLLPQEIERVICETEPEKPSTVISRIEEGLGPSSPYPTLTPELVSKTREGLPEKLRRRLAGDLDNIVLMALRKEPSRRYATVEQFSEDIRRHMEGLPVIARTDTLGYRTAKFIQRHRTGLAAVMLILLTLLSGIIVSLWQVRRADQQRRRAEHERIRAEEQESSKHRLLYATQMNLAYQAYENANIQRMLELLESQWPKPGQKDLRGFEWYYLWRLGHNNRFTTLPHANVNAVAFSPDNKTVATGGSDRVVRFWDVRTRQELFTLEGHRDAVDSAAFSPDGRILASGSRDGTVKLWDVSARQELCTLNRHKDRVGSVAFSPDGKLLATGSRDHTARLWNVVTQKELFILKGHTRWVVSVAFSPDGKILATGSTDRDIHLWDVAKKTKLFTLKGHRGSVWSVAFSPHGKILASGSGDRTVRLWDIDQRRELTTVYEHRDMVMCVAFSPDGKTLASGSLDSTVKLWNVSTMQELVTLKGYICLSLAFSPDGTRLAFGGEDTQAKLWDVVVQQEPDTLREHAGVVRSIAFSPDGKVLVSGSDDRTVKLWDVATRQEIVTFTGHTGEVYSVAFSPDGRTLASGGRDGTVRLWELLKRQSLATFTGHASEVWPVAFSPDGKILASGSGDKTVKLWDMTTRSELFTLTGHKRLIVYLAFSPDGKRLVTLSLDSTAKLWDMSTKQELITFKESQKWPLAAAFSPDSRILATGGTGSREVRLWYAATDEEVLAAYNKTHK